jgi:hypothetical protein
MLALGIGIGLGLGFLAGLVIGAAAAVFGLSWALAPKRGNSPCPFSSKPPS